MRIFIAYKFTGEDFNNLRQTLTAICNVLQKQGYSTYCSIEQEESFQRQGYTHKQIMENAFQELNNSDVVLAYINSNDRSEGQLIEIGYALGKGKRVILAYKQGLNVHSSKAVAEQVIEFKDNEDLLNKLTSLKI